MVDENLKIIKKETLGILPDGKIILFGSRARNEINQDSDYDILVVTEENMDVRKEMEFAGKIRRKLLEYNILSDVIIQTEKQISIKKTLPGHVIKNAISEGIIL